MQAILFLMQKYMKMDKNSGFTEEAVEEMINKGSKKELQIFKEKIESGIVSSKTEL